MRCVVCETRRGIPSCETCDREQAKRDHSPLVEALENIVLVTQSTSDAGRIARDALNAFRETIGE